MKLTVRKNGGFPSLLSNFFGTSLTDRDFFDFDSELFSSRLGINVPTVNMAETPKVYTLELAAPGLERKDFDVQIENHVLTISVEKEAETKEEKDEYFRREYSFNSFSRSFSLPENVKENEIDARYEHGVLRVTLPKAKETQTKAVKKVSVS